MKQKHNQTQKDINSLEKQVIWVYQANGKRKKIPLKGVCLKTFGFKIGDIVQYVGQGLNSGGIIWRIVADNPPRFDLVQLKMKRVNKWGGAQLLTKWVDPNTHKIATEYEKTGSIIIEPVFNFFPFISSCNKGKPIKMKNVYYRDIQKRITLIDTLELGIKWSELKSLIDVVVKERSD